MSGSLRRSARISKLRQGQTTSPTMSKTGQSLVALPDLHDRACTAHTVDTTSPLLMLPAELMLNICDHIFPSYHVERRYSIEETVPHEYEAFAALALTCRYLFPFAMRYLYRVCELQDYQNHGGFLRTTSTNPYLGSYVREIYAGDWEEILEDERIHIGAQMEHEISQLASPYTKKWISILPEDPESIDFALLLWRSRVHLQVLELPMTCKVVSTGLCIGGLSDGLPAWFDPIFHASSTWNESLLFDGFAKLHYLDVDMSAMAVEHLTKLMMLPSLNTLSMKNFEEPTGEWSWMLAQDSSTMSCLYIDACNLSSIMLSYILASCKSISRFKYSGFRSESYYDPSTYYTAMMEALFQHRRSLRELVLDDWDFRRHEGSMERFSWTVDFSAFKILQVVQIPHAMLVAECNLNDRNMNTNSEVAYSNTPRPLRSLRELLPESLEELRLFYDTIFLVDRSGHDVELRPFMRDGSNIPLKLIHIDYDHDIICKLPSDFVSLEKAFRQYDISFEYHIGCLLEDQIDVEHLAAELIDAELTGREGFALMAHMHSYSNSHRKIEDVRDIVRMEEELMGLDGSDEAEATRFDEYDRRGSA
ncbi:hypothetical protein ACN47E_009522 [Coniothyrium glycines]